MRKRFPFRIHPAAVLPVLLVSVTVGLGVVQFGRSMMFSPEITFDTRQRRSPIRDNKAEAVSYTTHRQRLSKYDTYLGKRMSNVETTDGGNGDVKVTSD
mmetsp:Transcript_17611/g.21685  ORF Transcript_17611/g.21685 Transcript_17611/m.21685 type:complete len:99 (+) Transcript_17611:163-459(+)